MVYTPLSVYTIVNQWYINNLGIGTKSDIVYKQGFYFTWIVKSYLKSLIMLVSSVIAVYPP